MEAAFDHDIENIHLAQWTNKKVKGDQTRPISTDRLCPLPPPTQIPNFSEIEYGMASKPKATI